MLDFENIVRSGTAEAASKLAEVAGEDFVKAVTAAYLAGKEKGKRDAMSAA